MVWWKNVQLAYKIYYVSGKKKKTCWEQAVDDFLLSYRTTPHKTTKISTDFINKTNAAKYADVKNNAKVHYLEVAGRRYNIKTQHINLFLQIVIIVNTI